MHARGLGPQPIPVDQFSLEKLVDAIKFMMEPAVSYDIFGLESTNCFIDGAIFPLNTEIDNGNIVNAMY